MKEPHNGHRPFLLYFFSVIALLVYLHGFFPAENSFVEIQSLPVQRNVNSKHQNTHKVFDKLVLMVIDALRYDFVFPRNSENYMMFTTSSILNNDSCLVKLKAQAPTVTMPRIKAITSGMVPTFFDVLSNFMSRDEFKPDSFIHQAKLNNYSIVFYGDDTWMKLFPNSFLRSEGTNSFFASDFKEVDDNVTRHLEEEFSRRDWDFFILHYLGLDHIGHMEGPKSVLIGPKLTEMDNIILRIYLHLKSMEEEGLKTLFIVTSDHGMKDSGGHGGMTKPEITLPLVSVGKTCNNIPGWPMDYMADQVDLAPTISYAFGLPTPVNSIGRIIPALFHGMKLATIYEILELNRKHLRHKAGFENEMNTEECDLENKLCLKRKENIYHDLSDLSNRLQTKVEFNVPLLVLSALVMWTLLIILVRGELYNFLRPKTATHYVLLVGTILYGISFTSTSMIEEEHQTWYFFWCTLCIFAMLESMHKSTFKIKAIVPWITLLCAHRILRKLNQTGDKWAMLPDIRGYLNLTENKPLLTLVFFLGLIALLYCAYTERCTTYQLLTFITALLINLFYRLSVSSVGFDSFYFPQTRGSFICSIFWIMTIVFSTQCFISKRKPVALAWSLITSILLKPHNVIILPVEIVCSRQIHKLYRNNEDVIWNILAHIWMGYVFYFYQGNGNSLANVDVSAGFVGLEEYNLLYSGLMVAAHTNSSHILAFLLSPKSNLVHATLRLYCLSLYCTLLAFQLNHLFIWSVFSPKLLYETNFTIIFLALLLFNSLIPLKNNYLSAFPGGNEKFDYHKI